MSDSLNRTPKIDRALAAFEWLPRERWVPDQLFNFFFIQGGQKCKICDNIITVSKQEAHCKMHLAQDKERRKEVKEESAVREVRELDTDTVFQYLASHPKGETVSGISTATKQHINDVYKVIKSLVNSGAVEVVGVHRIPGKRGKPAKIYGKKEVT